MKLPIYQIDAFASEPFTGNPAAICPLQSWLPDEVMQSIAEENNLSETAFFVPTDKGFRIRWFTPVAEVDLCGHATLASAYVIYNYHGFTEDRINFESKTGLLSVEKKDDLLVMDFPSQPPVQCSMPEEIVRAFKVKATECLKAEDYIVVFDHEDDVALAQPDFFELSKLDLRGVAITAKSNDCDFVARFFGPKLGIDEDPVTGSAYTQLVPYWSQALGVNKLYAKQVSTRGGELFCEVVGDRVNIAGRAVKYLVGEIDIKSKN